MQIVAWQPPFYGNHYLFLGKQKAFIIFGFCCVFGKGWVGSKFLEIGRFGNRLFNTGSGAAFGFLSVILNGT